jgi:hypothetical protein
MSVPAAKHSKINNFPSLSTGIILNYKVLTTILTHGILTNRICMRQANKKKCRF